MLLLIALFFFFPQMLKAPRAHTGVLSGEAKAAKSDEDLERMLAQLKS